MASSITGGWDPHQREFVKLAQQNGRHGRLHEVFADFCELSAISISNAVDRHQAEVREVRFVDITKRYDAASQSRFAHMLACVTLSLELRMHDCLGGIFMGLELGDQYRGQFFTPYEIARLMAAMLLSPEDLKRDCQRHGFLTLCEPAVGAGGLVIAAAESFVSAGLNYQRQLHVTAIDIDRLAVHMTYLQLSLLSIPAIVLHGNALSLEPWSHWATPAHILGGWDARLRARGPAVPRAETAKSSSPSAPALVEAADLRAAVLDQRARWEQTSLF